MGPTGCGRSLGHALGYRWLSIDANDRRSPVEARAAVGEWLGVEPDAFEVED